MNLSITSNKEIFGVGLGIYTLALIVTAPATLIDSSLQDASDNRLRLSNAQGTVWSGNGQLEIHDANGQNHASKKLQWVIAPQYLLRGDILCQITLDNTKQPFPVTASFSRIELANADINLPASVLGLGLPKLAPLGLTGDMLVHVNNLSIARDHIEGNANLQWRTAGSSLSPVSPLGDYEMQITGAGSTVNATLHTLQGTPQEGRQTPLQLNGSGSWTLDNSPTFLASADVLPAFQQQLSPFLRMIAVERSEGHFDLQLD